MSRTFLGNYVPAPFDLFMSGDYEKFFKFLKTDFKFFIFECPDEQWKMYKLITGGLEGGIVVNGRGQIKWPMYIQQHYDEWQDVLSYGDCKDVPTLVDEIEAHELLLYPDKKSVRSRGAKRIQSAKSTRPRKSTKSKQSTKSAKSTTGKKTKLRRTKPIPNRSKS